MLKRRKYTKRWLKEPDEFITTFGRVTNLVSHHGKALAWALLGMSLVSLAGGWFLYSRRVAEGKLETSLAQAYSLYRQAEASDKGDFSEALRAYQDVIREYPRPEKNHRAYLYLGRIYSHNKDFQKAASMYQKVAETSNKEALTREIALMGLGYSYEAMAQYPKAVDQYKKIVELEGASLKGESLKALGRCYELMKDRKSALTYYTRYLSDPSAQSSEEVKEKVEHLKALP